MQDRELEMLKRIFFRLFNTNWNLSHNFYCVMGDVPEGDNQIQEALYIAKIFKLDDEELEHILINLTTKKAV